MAKRLDSTSPLWWTLAQILIWILQRLEIPPQDAEQFCTLNPKIIEMALNVLIRALFDATYGAVEGLPVVAAHIRCGSHYKNLAAVFPLPPSPTPGVVDALMHDFRQFIRQSDVEFNPVWGKRMWPARVPAATQPTESAVADEVEPTPGSAVAPESQPPGKPDSADASTQAAPARINVDYVDPDIAHAIAHAVKRVRPAVPPPEPAAAAPVPAVEPEPPRGEPVPPPEPAPAEGVEDRAGAATAAAAETAGIQPKKRRGTRGPLPEKRDDVADEIRDDIRAERFTMREGRLYKDSRRVSQKKLTERYDCGKSTLLDALGVVWSEFLRNSDQ
jgi:hypothetical protein